MAKKKKGKGLKIFLLILVVGAVGGGIYFSMNRGAESDFIPFVETVQVQRQPMIERISANGSFVPEESRIVLSEISGEILEVFIETGDRVSEGDSLAQVDSEPYETALRQATITLNTTLSGVRQKILGLRTDYRNAMNNEAQTERAYGRNRELYESSAVSQETLLQSQYAWENALWMREVSRQNLNMALGLPLSEEPPAQTDGDEEAILSSPEVLQAQLNVDSARDSLEACLIKAPLAGTVTALQIDEGSLVSQATPLLKIDSLDRMKAVIYVDEVDIGKVNPEAVVEVTTDSLIGRTIEGRVDRVSPIVEQVGSIKASTVEIALQQNGLSLMSGASCAARINVVSRESALVIPVSSFTAEGGSFFTYLVSEDGEGVLLERREIGIGISTIENTEIISGLEEGERVVSSGLFGLRDGLRVRIEGSMEPEIPSGEEESDLAGSESSLNNEEAGDV